MGIDPKKVEVKYETLVVIWASLLVSQAVFLILIYFIRPRLFSEDPAQPLLGDKPLITVIFAAMAIAVLSLSYILRRQHTARALRDHDPSCVQTGLVLGCVLSEFCSILGLILAIGFSYHYFFIWSALGLFGVLFHFPRKGTYDAAILN
ncbi:MAG: hypothetical protein ACR2IH_07110 [Pyrinomonadaceae bacterium]